MPIRRRASRPGTFFMDSITFQVEYQPGMLDVDDIRQLARDSTHYTQKYLFEDEAEGSALITFYDGPSAEAFAQNMKAAGFRRGADR